MFPYNCNIQNLKKIQPHPYSSWCLMLFSWMSWTYSQMSPCHHTMHNGAVSSTGLPTWYRTCVIQKQPNLPKTAKRSGKNKPFSPKGKANVSFATNCSRGFCNPFQGVTYHCKLPKLEITTWKSTHPKEIPPFPCLLSGFQPLLSKTCHVDKLGTSTGGNCWGHHNQHCHFIPPIFRLGKQPMSMSKKNIIPKQLSSRVMVRKFILVQFISYLLPDFFLNQERNIEKNISWLNYNHNSPSPIDFPDI